MLLWRNKKYLPDSHSDLDLCLQHVFVEEFPGNSEYPQHIICGDKRKIFIWIFFLFGAMISVGLNVRYVSQHTLKATIRIV